MITFFNNKFFCKKYLTFTYNCGKLMKFALRRDSNEKKGVAQCYMMLL